MKIVDALLDTKPFQFGFFMHAIYKKCTKADVSRLAASVVKKGVDSGETLLVCAYKDDAQFDRYHLEGAIPFSEFSTRLDGLAKDTRLVFY